MTRASRLKDRLVAALERTPHSPACSSRLQFQSAVGSCDCDLDDLRHYWAGFRCEKWWAVVTRDGIAAVVKEDTRSAVDAVDGDTCVVEAHVWVEEEGR